MTTREIHQLEITDANNDEVVQFNFDIDGNSNPTIQELHDWERQYFFGGGWVVYQSPWRFFSPDFRGASPSRGTRGSQQLRVDSPPWAAPNLAAEDRANPVYDADPFYVEPLETFEPTALEMTRGAGSGSDLSHWREDALGNEMMTDSGSAELLGSITINYGAAEPYSLEM